MSYHPNIDSTSLRVIQYYIDQLREGNKTVEEQQKLLWGWIKQGVITFREYDVIVRHILKPSDLFDVNIPKVG